MKKPSLKYTLPDEASSTEATAMLNHNAAIRCPRGFEIPLIRGLQALEAYAQAHWLRYADKVCNDGVLGQYWIDWAIDMRGLLGGESGRLNCGHVSAYINNLMKYYGATEQDLKL